MAASVRQAAEVGQVPLRVLSWNVGRLYNERNENRLATDDIPQVSALLAAVEPDVILLQEVADDAQLQTLLAARADYHGEIAACCGYDRHVAVIARRELSPHFFHFHLGHTGRGAVQVSLDVRGHAMVALGIHTDVFSLANRSAQIAGIVAWAASPALANLPRIIGGDFNFDPTYSRADRNNYGSLTAQHVDAGLRAGATLLGLVRFDQFHVGNIASSRLSMRVLPTRLPLGDHNPILLEIASE